MPRTPGRKAVPWLLLLDVAMILRDHWGFLDDRDRRELSRIVGKSKGRPGNLTPQERRELVRILRKLDPVTAGRRLLPFSGGVRKSKLRARRRG
jgi:hypothetical protein